MSAARWLSCAVVMAGAVAGSMLDATRAAQPVRSGPYYVVAADFHVHAFPGDGALPPWELAREASRRGLHAVVISNHNQTKTAKFIPGVFSTGALLPLVIPSQEVTTPRFHLVAVGISSAIDWRGSDSGIIDAIHAQGGLVIAAHPIGRYWQGGDAMLARLDGAEVAHPLTDALDTGRAELSAFFTRVRAVNPDVAPIGSSDFHMVAPLGACRTYVFAETVTVAGVLDAIRAGRTVAQDRHGALYGAPALIQALKQSGAAATAPPTSRWVWLSAAMVLVGLLGLIVLS